MENKKLQEVILDAIDEAVILESARERFEIENMLLVAQRLSGAPYSLVLEQYNHRMNKKYHLEDIFG